MARAKRTHRAEARRRYRSEQALGVPSDAVGLDESPAAQARPQVELDRDRRPLDQPLAVASATRSVPPSGRSICDRTCAPPATHPPSSVVDPGRDHARHDGPVHRDPARGSERHPRRRDGLPLPVLHRHAGDRRRVHRRVPRAAREAGCSGSWSGSSRRRATRSSCFAGSSASHRPQRRSSSRVTSSSRRSCCRRSSARSSHRPRPGIAVPALQPEIAAGPGAVTHRAPTAAHARRARRPRPAASGPSQGAANHQPSLRIPAWPICRTPFGRRPRGLRRRVGELRTSRATRFTTDPSLAARHRRAATHADVPRRVAAPRSTARA